MSGQTKETVIIVHGTFANPKPGKALWYQPRDSAPAEGFIAKLNAALQKRGSAARCWSHCDKSDMAFQWSGQNTWIARTHAATELGEYVTKLRNDGWRCHIIAHSHGGNVLAEALPQIVAPTTSGAPLGRLVTLGCPFMDVITQILINDQRREYNLRWACFMLLIVVMLQLLWPDAMLPSRPINISGFLVFLSVLLLLGLYVRLHKFAFRSRTRNGIDYRDDLFTFKPNWKYLWIEAFFWLLAAIVCNYIIFPPHHLAISAALCASLFVTMFVRRKLLDRVISLTRTKSFGPMPAFLSINSRMDEAWQVLHHLRNTDNPLAVRSTLLHYLISETRLNYKQKVDLDKIYYGTVGYLATIGALTSSVLVVAIIYLIAIPDLGAIGDLFLPQPVYFPFSDYPGWLEGIARLCLLVIIPVTTVGLFLAMIFGSKFFQAFLSPYRWGARVLSAPANFLHELVIFGVREASWSVFLKMAMGLEGYRFEAPRIHKSPTYLNIMNVKYEDMPIGAERRALRSRTAWIKRHVENISAVFSKLSIAAGDISALLQSIEADQSLVHAAYYTDEECIARIADWIADTDMNSASASKTSEAQCIDAGSSSARL
jgi:hypothetical protein